MGNHPTACGASPCISVRGLANYMTASSDQDRLDVIRGFKSKRALTFGHYREACTDVRRYYREDQPPDWFADRAQQYRQMARGAGSPHDRAHLTHTATGLELYYANFGQLEYEIQPLPRQSLIAEGVKISAQPSMHARENGEERVVFYHFGVAQPTPEMRWVIPTVTWMVSSSYLSLQAPDSAQYILVREGDIVTPPPRLQKAVQSIRAALRQVAQDWYRV